MRSGAAAMLLAAVLNSAAAQDTRPIFVYSGGKMSPVAQLTPQGIAEFGPGGDDEQHASRWLAPWVAPERSYHYLGQNGARGTATAAGAEIDGCFSLTGAVKLDAPADVDGLLTTWPLPVTPPAIATTPRQFQVLRRIARGVLREQGLPPAHIDKMLASTMRIQREGSPRAVAIGTHGATPARMIASYDWNSVDDALHAGREPRADAPYAGYALTLILEADSRHHYRPAHVLFQRSASESEMSYYAFIAAADIDDDGQDEVILTGSGYEWWWFEVLGKRQSKWRTLAQGGGGGC